MYLPVLRVAIEVDGPTHFLPIWGEEKLQKRQEIDRKKTGLILQDGITLVRMKALAKNYSKVKLVKAWQDLEKILLSNPSGLLEIEVS